jgi:hypothetical protein
MNDFSSSFRAALPRGGAGLVLQRLVVVTAYSDDRFLPALVNSLKPQKVYVVLEESTPSATVDAIRIGIGKRLSRLALGAAPRLMHAKLYFLTWSKPDGTGKIHRLHFGSANASEVAFTQAGGNAEVFAWCRVLAKTHAPVLGWFRAIMNGASRTDALSADLEGLSISLLSSAS